MDIDPRKQERQGRAKVTKAAIIEAAAGILEEDGASRLAANRTAERAGVSIGSLYQYFRTRRQLSSHSACLSASLKPPIIRRPAANTKRYPRVADAAQSGGQEQRGPAVLYHLYPGFHSACLMA